MPHLHLPVKHTEDDLALAGALATALRSEELYVAWSLTDGPAQPVIPASLVQHEPQSRPAPPRRGLLARLFGRH